MSTWWLSKCSYGDILQTSQKKKLVTKNTAISNGQVFWSNAEGMPPNKPLSMLVAPWNCNDNLFFSWYFKSCLPISYQYRSIWCYCQSIYTFDIAHMFQIMLTDFVSTVTGKDMNGSEKSSTWERSLVNVKSAAIISASYNNEEDIYTDLSRTWAYFIIQ